MRLDDPDFWRSINASRAELEFLLAYADEDFASDQELADILLHLAQHNGARSVNGLIMAQGEENIDGLVYDVYSRAEVNRVFSVLRDVAFRAYHAYSTYVSVGAYTLSVYPFADVGPERSCEIIAVAREDVPGRDDAADRFFIDYDVTVHDGSGTVIPYTATLEFSPRGFHYVASIARRDEGVPCASDCQELIPIPEWYPQDDYQRILEEATFFSTDPLYTLLDIDHNGTLELILKSIEDGKLDLRIYFRGCDRFIAPTLRYQFDSDTVVRLARTGDPFDALLLDEPVMLGCRSLSLLDVVEQSNGIAVGLRMPYSGWDVEEQTSIISPKKLPWLDAEAYNGLDTFLP